MVKKKKRVKLLDTIIESIRKKWETASIRDLVYLTAYLSAVALAYGTLRNLAGFVTEIKYLRWIRYLMDPIGSEEIKLEDFNMETLIKSFAIAYIILKIDIDDVTGALGKLTSVITTLG